MAPSRPPPWRSSGGAGAGGKKRKREEPVEEEPEVDENTRLEGKVVRFAAKRGFGFIKPLEGGKEVFVHWAQIASSSKWPSLERDMVVQYSPGTDEDGRNAAFNVTTETGEDIDLEEEQEDRKLSNFRVTGTVKFFSRGGYGFICTNEAIKWPQKLPAGSDIYVGREELQVAEDSLCRLRQGQEVEFNVYKCEGKEHIAAANVTEVGGEEIMLEKGEGKGKGKGKSKGKKGKGWNDSRDSKHSGKNGSKGKASGVQRTIGKDSKGSGKTRSSSPPARPALGGRSSKGKESSGKGSGGKKGKSKGKGR